MDIHDLIKLYKHDIPKLLIMQCVRLGINVLVARGSKFGRQYERQPPQFLQLFADWLNLTSDGMSFLLDQLRSPNFWLETSPGSWEFKGLSSYLDHTTCSSTLASSFEENSSLECDNLKGYITVGKGI